MGKIRVKKKSFETNRANNETKNIHCYFHKALVRN